MKIFLLMILLVGISFGKSNESCYTVQLMSRDNSAKNLKTLQESVYPKSCKIMQIGKILTIRCGCYEKFVSAQTKLRKVIGKYRGAAVSTTYRYRFDDANVKKSNFKNTKKKTSHSSKENSGVRSEVENEIRLILQVFLYKNDLENAYKVATIGYKKYPNSYYWNQKMAELSRWTNRGANSIKYMRFLYSRNYDSTIEKELISYGIELHQYDKIEPLVLHRMKIDPTKKNIDLMVYTYKKMGSPEMIIEILDEEYKKDKRKGYLITQALQVSLELGDLELAKKYTTILEMHKPYSKKDAALIARYYYVTRNVSMSYKSLSYVENKKSLELHEKRDDFIKYNELKSDLGWYLQDNEEAAQASKALMDINASRLVDYERIFFVYQKSNPQLALHAIKSAFQTYKNSYLFYSYANVAMNEKKYAELKVFLAELDAQNSPLLKESLYWIVKSKVYGHYHQYILQEEMLKRASSLAKNSFAIKLDMLWLYMELKNNVKVKMTLLKMSESQNLEPSAYLPMASGYFFLHDINRASYYVEKLLEIDAPSTKLLEFKFLQAYIYQMQNNEPAFIHSMRKIEHELKKNAKVEPILKEDDKYLSNYLRAAMFVINPDKFEKKLQKAKAYLSHQNYDEISYSWAMRNSAYDKSLQIYHTMSKHSLWLDFSNALVFQNHTEIDNLLDLYLVSLSVGDSAQAAKNDGQISLAQTITFETLLHNEKSQNAYIGHLNLSKERADLFDAKLSYYERDALLKKYIDMKNSTYIQDGYYLFSHLNYSQDKSLNTKQLLSTPSDTFSAGMGIKRSYNRGFMEFNIAYHNAMRSYSEFDFKSSYQASSDLVGRVEIGKNIDALESTQLVVGGKKDKLSLELQWNFLTSTSLDALYSFNEYTSQDEVNLGSGNYGRLMLSQQIRNGYPDIRVATFYDFGMYKETQGSRGVIDEIQLNNTAVLPNNFYNIGLNLSYGMANSNIYTRVWRPYIEFYPYYNSDTQDYTYGFNLGYGGKIWHQDHLLVGVSYTDSVSGTGGTLLELFLNYKFMYYHP